MIKKLLLAIILSTAFLTSNAQQPITDTVAINRAQSVYLEFFGPGLTLSANYNTRFAKKRGGWGARIGTGGSADEDYSSFTIPMQINYLLGKSTKFFEIGGGATYIRYNNKEGNGGGYMPFADGTTIAGTTTFGYQSQPLRHGFNFRASFNMLFTDNLFMPFGGISIGYTFK